MTSECGLSKGGDAVQRPAANGPG